MKITGRIKDMLIRGGENIYPREIEDFLYTHPKISEAQVFGVPTKKWVKRCVFGFSSKMGSRLLIKRFVNSVKARLPILKSHDILGSLKNFR